MKKFFNATLISISLILSLSSCKSDKSKAETEGLNSTDIEIYEAAAQENVSDLKPEEMIFLVEGAVDSWFFYNLDNYRSYEAIMRSTDYDSTRNVHIHHVRYRFMNKEGGYETTEKTFEVSFTLNENGTPDFEVKDIPTTEKKFTIDTAQK